MPQVKLTDLDTFRSEVRAGRASGAGLFRVHVAKPKTVGGSDSRVLRFCFSDGSVDRAGDPSIRPAGSFKPSTETRSHYGRMTAERRRSAAPPT